MMRIDDLLGRFASWQDQLQDLRDCTENLQQEDIEAIDDLNADVSSVEDDLRFKLLMKRCEV